MINGISREAFERFCRRRRVRLAVLFGSSVTGRRTAHSDLDLAFWLRDEPKPSSELDLTNVLMSLLHCNDVDVVVLNHANPLLQWQVASTGKPLYERQAGAFVRFQVRAFRRYHDGHRIYQWTRAYLHEWLKATRHAGSHPA